MLAKVPPVVRLQKYLVALSQNVRLQNYSARCRRLVRLPSRRAGQYGQGIGTTFGISLIALAVNAVMIVGVMSFTQAVLTLVKGGERVVVSDNVYGGTHRLFTKVLAQYAG